MDWLNKSFEQYSILWLITSAIVGGIISYSLKFIFDELLGNYLKKKRALEKVVDEYSTPLLKTGLSLERRINNFIRNAEKDWFNKSEYYRISTLYIFCEFFGWVYILEKETSFLKFPSTQKTKKFEDYLNGIFRAITSFAYFRDISDSEKKTESNIPRLILRAIGEIIVTDSNEGLSIKNFTNFSEEYKKDKNTFFWLKKLETFLENIDNEENSLKWDRFILLGANLKKFLLFLDEDQLFLKNEEFANLDLIKNKEISKSFSDKP